jgi:hypothetical protein
MDIRKTPAALIYQPDTTDTMNQNLLQMPAFGVASGQAINLESTEMTSVGRKPTLRTWGGSLNNFYYIMNTIAGSATGNPSASFTGIKDPSTGKPMHDGRFMLDAILRGLWVESVCGTTYGAFVNSRIRADKRFFVPENRAGYTFFNQQYLDSFGGASIMGSSAFSSVEAVMMRVAAIFQAFPACCSTPTLIDAADAMAIPVHDFIVLKNPKYFGAPFVLNQTMVLPPLNFTAPPNCNILFPCMYNTVQWMHDYDSDPTRGMYKQQNVFGNSLGDTVFARYIMVPNSLLDGRKDSRSHPPITLDERYRGVGMEFGTVEYLVAARNATYAVAEAIIKDPKKKAALNKIIKKLGLKDLGTINDYYDKLLKDPTKELPTPMVENERQIALENAYHGIIAAGKVSGSAEATKIIGEVQPNVNDVLNRHAVFKFIMSRFNSRTVTVNSDFNPYPVCGFPAAVMADDNRKGQKTLKTLLGVIQMIRHTISAQGFASTSMVMSTVRFLDEGADIDMFGNPLYIEDTPIDKAEVDPETLKYLPINGGYDGQLGAPKTKYVYDIETKADMFTSDYDLYENGTNEKLKWAKDMFVGNMPVTKKGRKPNPEATEALDSFIDSTYLPNRVMMFYYKIFRQDPKAHFMVGRKVINQKDTWFIYDSINEALAELENKKMMTDYESALAFVRREVVNEEQYFFGILGASYQTDDGKGNTIFYTKGLNPDPAAARMEFDDYADRQEYYGISTERFNALSESLATDYKHAGTFSSIREKKPRTPFIKERRDVVVKYASEVSKYVYSIR